MGLYRAKIAQFSLASAGLAPPVPVKTGRTIAFQQPWLGSQVALDLTLTPTWGFAGGGHRRSLPAMPGDSLVGGGLLRPQFLRARRLWRRRNPQVLLDPRAGAGPRQN